MNTLLTQLFRGLIITAGIAALSGCSTVGYYTRIIQGHFDIISQQKPIEAWLEQTGIDEDLRHKLLLVKEVRHFASEALHLPENDSYLSYADIGRAYVAWNVVATPALSLTPKTWCYPIAGCVTYRGYHSREDAQAYADSLAEQGYDVTINGAAAYSTLGWFDDPVLNTMIAWREPALIGIILHELAHQKLYIKDSSAFNESFASFVQREGVSRWYSAQGDIDTLTQEQERYQRRRDFLGLLNDTRQALEALYAQNLIPTAALAEKARIFATLQKQYQQIKTTQWQGYSGYDRWFSRPLNNARLASVSTYTRYIPAFQQLLDQNNGDLLAFYHETEKIAALPKDKREQILQALLLAHGVKE
ncbi:MAG: aminopeptidase [Gammaproteobacteria bacterium]|nr:aminopeptidase [Gammaproteobacteria bacterium]